MLTILFIGPNRLSLLAILMPEVSKGSTEIQKTNYGAVGMLKLKMLVTSIFNGGRRGQIDRAL